MSTNILGVSVGQSGAPKSFIRGQTMEFVMDLPPEVPTGFFLGEFVTTTLACQLRKLENAGEDGLITTLVVSWDDAFGTRLRFKSSVDDDTSLWALGPAEFDVLFTRTENIEQFTGRPGSTQVKTFRSLPVQIIIEDGVTA